MSQPRTLTESIFLSRCPRCREGRLFPFPAYSAQFLKANSKCPCCGQGFVIEPGFFLGAAFFSYAINAVLLTAMAWALFYAGVDLTIGVMIISIVVVVFGLLPITLRLSKSAWAHLFIRYEGPCGSLQKKD